MLTFFFFFFFFPLLFKSQVLKRLKDIHCNDSTATKLGFQSEWKQETPLKYVSHPILLTKKKMEKEKGNIKY